MNDNTPAIACSDLCKSFAIGGGVQQVLQGAHLQVAKGEAVMISGASGSGKTTFLHLLGGLDKPQRGEVEIGGEKLSSLPPSRLSKLRNRKLGFVFQFHLLLPEFTAAENAAMPLLIRGEDKQQSLNRARALLAELDLQSCADKRPAMLSGGERQRVAIARALSGGAECVLADEPTGNLDRKNADAVFDMLLSQCRMRGMSLITATHDWRLLARADRCLELKEGKLWHRENPAQV